MYIQSQIFNDHLKHMLIACIKEENQHIWSHHLRLQRHWGLCHQCSQGVFFETLEWHYVFGVNDAQIIVSVPTNELCLYSNPLQ